MAQITGGGTFGFPTAYFVIKSVASNWVLDVAGDGIEDGTEIILWPEKDFSLLECKLCGRRKPPCTSLKQALGSSAMRNADANNQVSITSQHPCVNEQRATTPRRCSSSIPLVRCALGLRDMQLTLKVILFFLLLLFALNRRCIVIHRWSIGTPPQAPNITSLSQCICPPIT